MVLAKSMPWKLETTQAEMFDLTSVQNARNFVTWLGESSIRLQTCCLPLAAFLTAVWKVPSQTWPTAAEFWMSLCAPYSVQ